MVKELDDGTIISSYFELADEQERAPDREGDQLMSGQVTKVHYPDDLTNISKKYIEYDVIALDNASGMRTFRNVRKVEIFGGSNDNSEVIFEPTEIPAEGEKLSTETLFKHMNGTIVILGFLNNNSRKPIILGALQHPKNVGSNREDGIHSLVNFRGFSQKVNKGGELELVFTGAKLPDGKQADENITPITLKVGKTGEITTETGHKILFLGEKDKEKIQIQTAANQLFIIDDTKDSESISLLHKQGSLLNVDKTGSCKIISKDGNYLFLDSVDGAVSLVQKDGHLFAMTGDDIVITHKNGKEIITLADGKIQFTSSGEIINQASACSFNAGTVGLKDQLGSECKISEGKVALGNSLIPPEPITGAKAEVLDILSKLLETLASDTYAGFGAPSTNVAKYAVLQAYLDSLKGSL